MSCCLLVFISFYFETIFSIGNGLLHCLVVLCSLLLSTVSGEGAKERSDRVLVTPWVKFLWESYRNMLELLKNNNTVQTVYAAVAKDAFRFCLNFQRRTEFRKLCDTVMKCCGEVKYFYV